MKANKLLPLAIIFAKQKDQASSQVRYESRLRARPPNAIKMWLKAFGRLTSPAPQIMVAQEDINNTVGVGYQVTPFSIGTPNLEFLAQAFNRI